SGSRPERNPCADRRTGRRQPNCHAVSGFPLSSRPCHDLRQTKKEELVLAQFAVGQVLHSRTSESIRYLIAQNGRVFEKRPLILTHRQYKLLRPVYASISVWQEKIYPPRAR